LGTFKKFWGLSKNFFMFLVSGKGGGVDRSLTIEVLGTGIGESVLKEGVVVQECRVLRNVINERPLII